MTTLDITNNCDFACVHCDRINDKSGDLPPAAWKHIMRQFYPHGTKLVFAGGEPLRYKHLEELLAEARTAFPKDEQLYESLLRGVSTPDELFDKVTRNKLVITTNGQALDDKKTRMLEKYGVVVWLSLDGASEDVFKHIRRGSKYTRIRRNLDAAKEVVPVHINYVVMQQNAGEVLSAAQLTDNLGLNLIRFTPVRAINNARINDVRIDHQEYIDCIDATLDYAERGGLADSTLILFNLLQTQKVYLLHNGLYSKMRARIDASKNVFLSEKQCDRFNNLDRGVVTPRGVFSGCCNASSLPAFHMGSLLEQDIEAIASPSEMSALFSQTPEYCVDCSYLAVCRGGCRLLSYEAYGDPLKVDPTCPFQLPERRQRELVKSE